MLETGAAIGASRLTVGGDSADFSAVADKLAEMAELALPYGIAVDLEFMPFRPVQSLAARGRRGDARRTIRTPTS